MFAALPPDVTEALQKRYPFYVWDEATGVVRWMASFDTIEEDVDGLVAAAGESVGHETGSRHHPDPGAGHVGWLRG